MHKGHMMPLSFGAIKATLRGKRGVGFSRGLPSKLREEAVTFVFLVAESLRNKGLSHFRDLREERRESIGAVFFV